AKEFTSQLPRRANRIMDALVDGELTVRVDAFDEQRVLRVAQHLTSRVVVGMVLSAIIVGAALMMGVEASWTLFGYPAVAIVFFVVAAVAGLVLVGHTVVTDRRDARRGRQGTSGEVR